MLYFSGFHALILCTIIALHGKGKGYKQYMLCNIASSNRGGGRFKFVYPVHASRSFIPSTQQVTMGSIK